MSVTETNIDATRGGCEGWKVVPSVVILDGLIHVVSIKHVDIVTSVRTEKHGSVLHVNMKVGTFWVDISHFLGLILL